MIKIGKNVDTVYIHSNLLNYKKQNAITLVALIITIIILLILAGITINTIIGQDGLLRKAQIAREKYEEEAIKEEIEMAILDIQISNNMDITMKDIIEQLPIKLIGLTWIDANSLEPLGEYKGYKIKIKSDYTVEVLSKTEENIQQKVTVTVLAEENGEVQGSGEYKVGEKIELKAIPDEDYVFSGWYIGDTKISNQNPFTYEVQQEITITAQFSFDDWGNALDNSYDSYVVIENESKRFYIDEGLYGATIAISIETRYGENESSTSIYFYDKNDNKIEEVGIQFYKSGGATKKDTYTYVIPNNCKYIEFCVGPTNISGFKPYIYVYNISVVILEEQDAVLKKDGIELSKIKRKELEIVKYIDYKIEDGEWQEYTQPIELKEGIIYTRAYDSNRNQILAEDIYRLKCEESLNPETLQYNCKILTGQSKKIKVDTEVIGKEIKINLETKYGRDSNSTSIYFYDKDNNQIEGVGTHFTKSGGTTTKGIYTYVIPDNCEYIEFGVGDGSYKPYIYINNIEM